MHAVIASALSLFLVENAKVTIYVAVILVKGNWCGRGRTPPGINPEEGKADKSKYPFWLCELSLG